MDDDKLYERVERALAAARFEGDNEALAAIAVIRPAVIEECARVIAHEMPGPFAVIGNELIAAIRALAAPRVEQENDDGR